LPTIAFISKNRDIVFTRLTIGEKCTGNFSSCIGSLEIIRSGYSNSNENIFSLSKVAQPLALLSGRT